MVLNQKYKVKIPNNVEILYFEKKNIVIIIGKLGKKILKFKTKILVNTKLKLIEITTNYLSIQNNSKIKKVKSYQGTALALLKQAFLEVSILLYKKIKLVGVGYKAVVDNKFLILKLGYSHNIYFRVPSDITIMCLKSNKIFILGNSYEKITQIAFLIKSYKFPEPYKGKGILYENEKIVLKEGKKI